jgi:hypothetical protein
MEILINELSLHGQFATVDDFVNAAVKPLLLLLQQIDPARDFLLKKYDLWSANVTTTATLREVFKGSYSRTNDEIRKSKTQLTVLLDNPYWEDDRKHNTPDNYQYNAANIFNTSLAESCERDKVVMSFVSSQFNSAILIVNKNSTSISIDNLFDHTHLYALVRRKRLIVDFSLNDTTRFKKTHFNVQGKVVYKELSTKCFWYEDNLHHTHYEVFDRKQEHIGIADMSGDVDVSQRVDGRKLFD